MLFDGGEGDGLRIWGCDWQGVDGFLVITVRTELAKLLHGIGEEGEGELLHGGLGLFCGLGDRAADGDAASAGSDAAHFSDT